MLVVLEQAHSEIINLIEKNQTDTALGLLEQCQQGAIGVGMIIDKSEGEGTDEVHQLEEYCEMIWQISEDLKTGEAINARKLKKKLRKQLLNVSNGIQNRTPTQKEVIFLPYKASMWDSLESVWRKMDADPDVTAIVIPIPYFDKNPDGSVREMHYEINEFPDDVPVVHYKTYDIEAKHPDAMLGDEFWSAATTGCNAAV